MENNTINILEEKENEPRKITSNKEDNEDKTQQQKAYKNTRAIKCSSAFANYTQIIKKFSCVK